MEPEILAPEVKVPKPKAEPKTLVTMAQMEAKLVKHTPADQKVILSYLNLKYGQVAAS